MTRKEFFKKLGIGVAAIVVAPKVIAETKPNNTIIWDEAAIMPKKFDSIGLWIPEKKGVKYPLTYAECYKMPDTYLDLVRKYQHCYDEAWMKLYAALEKSKP